MLRLMITLVSFSLVALSCNNGDSSGETTHQHSGPPAPKTQEDSLFHDVMKGHDAGMAKAGKLRGNINVTKQLLDSLDKLPAKKVDAAYKQRLIGLQKALVTADEDMFKWMKDFKHDSASDNKELRIKYLEAEKAKVTVVKDQIFSALNQADSVLRPAGSKQ